MTPEDDINLESDVAYLKGRISELENNVWLLMNLVGNMSTEGANGGGLETMQEPVLGSQDIPDVIPRGGANVPGATNLNDILYYNDSSGEWLVLAAPATTGNFYLKVESGTLKWQAAGAC